MGYIEVFPAVPDSWKDISFSTLRAQGGFLISARKENAVFKEIKIDAEHGGWMHLKIPFRDFTLSDKNLKFILKDQILTVLMTRGESITIMNNNP